ncbi:hypothetical protein Ssi03_08310 [Sphaerisporangium siamense]|uniref:ABC-type Fe3+-siderophore transport system permease subunit n=2 Tax=Sphaerisporangium TaxID=321315 RepID=A0A7W8YZ87_9ACTN|nr:MULTISPECIES: hypothetical protein [Sphaerisporangium]MBB4705772.1 ABC-type Fe3+-siderophore transport system permease subunit [Sphaerisporangium siamense]MBB5624537.1 ABC-type Fe3+-siderophore transport system permease subunit [Sphaerisporangium krabiense]GII61507.1 hypothetical protein Skr01_15920 [Sphaerisporangium krabiense]GII82841.1 hypothetical protein Ssi03_08310 [Sphaerisporangium siamense]
MSPLGKYYVGAAIASVLVFLLLPTPIDLLLVVAILGAPVAVYFMLDESQRARLRRIRRRQIGR